MKKILCIIIAVLLMIPSFTAFAFEDVPKDHWAKDYIDKLSEMGIINGYEDLTFRPDGNVTRGEFAKILCLSFDLSDEGIKFDDVSGHWAEKYANVSGSVIYTSGLAFNPDTPIKRAEIAYALSGALSLPEATKGLDEIFSDYETVDDVLSQKVASAFQAGIIEGYSDGEIKGNSPVTRAEACALVMRAIKYRDSEDLSDEENQVEYESKEPDKEDDKEENPGKDENFGLEHIYTLFPARDLILVTSAREAIDGETFDKALRITYTLAGDDKEYSSVISEDSDIEIIGGRSNLFDIKKGDILITDSGFLKHIDRIFVLACLGDNINQGAVSYIPTGSKVGLKGSDKKYEFISGKIESRKTKDKAVVVTLDDGETVAIPRSVDISIYRHKLKSPWESASPTAIYPENAVLFARYTDGVVTDAVLAIYE